MEFITIVGLISAIIFIISCVTIYHNTNSFEPVQRVVYIIVRNSCCLLYNFSNLQYGCKRYPYKK